MNRRIKGDLQKLLPLLNNADVVIMVLGEHGLQSGEGRSRTDIGFARCATRIIGSSLSKSILILFWF